jgi:hypothetical protein
MMRRLLATLLLLLAAYGATFWRSPVPQPSFDPRVTFDDLMPEIRRGGLPVMGAVDLVGAWHLHSANRDFGSYSALAALPDGQLLAVSDKNGVLRFDPPGRRVPQRTAIRPLFGGNPFIAKHEADAEAVAIDPATGDVWASFEGNAVFVRFAPDFSTYAKVAAPVLEEWPDNSGPEAMTRLADGRFVAMIEDSTSLLHPDRHPVLVYRGAPRPGEVPLRLAVEMPGGFRPTDAAQLPDGRLLVLGRKVTLTGFTCVLALVDPREFKAGAVVIARELARVDDPRLRDNYEGLAVVREADGAVTLWLVSDDNLSTWFQRTLLLELRWRG